MQSHCDIYPCKNFDSSGKKCTEYYKESTGFYSPNSFAEVVPGHGQHTLKMHTVRLYSLLTAEMIETTFKGAGHGSFIHLHGYFVLKVGETEITVDYDEWDVP